MKYSTIVMSISVLLLLLVSFIAPAYAYDGKTYIAINAGLAKLDQDVDSSYALTDDSDEAYELTIGWDIGNRFSLEMSWSDLGNFDYERRFPTADFEEVSLVSFRVNGVYYLFGSQGFTGVQDRLGFNVFAKFGIGAMDERNLFSRNDLNHNFEDTFFSYGIGGELALNPYTYLRVQVQGFDDYLALGSAAIMWRWGRSR